MRGEKMSKRFGNITTPRDLREDGVDAGAIRLLMFQTHYRQQLDLTDEGLAAAQEGFAQAGRVPEPAAEGEDQARTRRGWRRRPSGSTGMWRRHSTMT